MIKWLVKLLIFCSLVTLYFWIILLEVEYRHQLGEMDGLKIQLNDLKQTVDKHGMIEDYLNQGHGRLK